MMASAAAIGSDNMKTTNGDASPEGRARGNMAEPLAIIGFSFKFPQEATSPDSFWEMLMERRSARTEIPKDRFNIDAYYHPDGEKPGMINLRHGHFIKEDLTLFDAPFFSITPSEASCMDPQQRWLLECTYRALENAGIPMEKAAGTATSVHVGCWTREFDSLFQRDGEAQAKYLATGAGNAMIANRVSWFFNLRGPSMAIDTACSSSLIAFHLACQALRAGETEMGLVGGCNLFYNADGIAPLTALGFLSPDGKSYSFDSRANGYARGEGIGMVVLKRLSDALRDGDTVRAVIRGSGSNQDGRTPGLTQPSSQAQEELIRSVYRSAGLDGPEELERTKFFEAHGTGTGIGDPLEAAAIAAVFGTKEKGAGKGGGGDQGEEGPRKAEKKVIVGALKSTIGHTEGASGIAGVVKAALVLEKGIVPPNMWFEKPNEKIDEGWGLKFPTAPEIWPIDGLRRASVNSFGYGGSNAHVVLDDAYHYFESRGITGRHNTVKSPRLPGTASVMTSPPVNSDGKGLINGEPSVVNGGQTETCSLGVPQQANGTTTDVKNDDPESTREGQTEPAALGSALDGSSGTGVAALPNVNGVTHEVMNGQAEPALMGPGQVGNGVSGGLDGGQANGLEAEEQEKPVTGSSDVAVNINSNPLPNGKSDGQTNGQAEAPAVDHARISNGECNGQPGSYPADRTDAHAEPNVQEPPAPVEGLVNGSTIDKACEFVTPYPVEAVADGVEGSRNNQQTEAAADIHIDQLAEGGETHSEFSSAHTELPVQETVEASNGPPHGITTEEAAKPAMLESSQLSEGAEGADGAPKKPDQNSTHDQANPSSQDQANGQVHNQADDDGYGHGHGQDRVHNTHNPSRQRLLIWSSHDEDGIRRLTTSYGEYLARSPAAADRLASLGEAAFLDRLSYTLSSRRTIFPWRAFTLARGHAEAEAALLPRDEGGGNGGPATGPMATATRRAKGFTSRPVRAPSSLPRVAFIFTGQGAQWQAMGRELMVYPAYAKAMRAADECLRGMGCEWSLVRELSGEEDAGGRSTASSSIDEPSRSQPACAAVQIAVVDLLRCWGVEPVAVVGHSSGEMAAAYCAGHISADAAMRAAYFRGALAQSLMQKKTAAAAATTDEAAAGVTTHSMMAVGLSEAEVSPYIEGLEGSIAVGCVNSPKNVTLTGQTEGLVRLRGNLEGDGIFCRLLKVGNAYHSRFMEEIAPGYRQRLDEAALEGRRRDNGDAEHAAGRKGPVMFSSVTGKLATPKQVGCSDYWVQNMVSPVLFSEAMAQMLAWSPEDAAARMQGSQEAAGVNYVLEIGPHAALRRYVQEVLEHSAQTGKGGAVAYDSVLTRGVSAQETVLTAAGNLFCAGLSRLDLGSVNCPDRSACGGGCQRMMVDLPEYPFNHSQGYWTESRISRNVRFRRLPRNDFIGSQVADWDPAEARWRTYIRISEHGWIRDHEVMGKLLYPAAGMLVMALEAACQLADPDRVPVVGYRLREVVFDKALIIPPTQEGIEIQFHLRVDTLSHFGGATGWSEFKLCSYDNGEWREHCRGAIVLEYAGTKAAAAAPAAAAPAPGDLTTGTREKELRAKKLLRAARDLERRCTIKLDSSSLYEICGTYGLVFGPSFRTLTSIRHGAPPGSSGGEGKQQQRREAVAHVRPREAPQPGHWAPSAEHVIHPATLDGILQTVFPALTGGGGGHGAEDMRTLVPSFVRELWISADVCHQAGEQQQQPIRACATAKRRGFREAECEITVSDAAGERLLVELVGYRVTAVGGEGQVADGAGDGDGGWRRICFGIDWRPDVDMLDTEKTSWLSTPLSGTALPETLSDNRYEDAEFVCFHFVTKTLQYVEANGIRPPPGHLEKYLEWMRYQVGRFEENASCFAGHGRPEWRVLAHDEAYVTAAIERIIRTPEGKVILRVGPNLDAILRGELDPLNLMFGDDLLQEFYRFGLGIDRVYAKIDRLVDAMAHKRPGLRVLEIGAGTGGTTVHVMKTLTTHGDDGEEGTPRFGHYTYTDISPGFFEKAKEMFKEVAGRMSFKALDAARDPVDQGFEEGGYDLVVASNVLHATKSMDVTLANARRLLKAGGKLLLVELTNLDILRAGFNSGLLEGWWLGTEPHRRWGPLMSEQEWDEYLWRAGFTGTDVAIRDWEDERTHMTSVLVATAVPLVQANGELSKKKPAPKTIIIAEGSSAGQHEIANELKCSLEGLLGGDSKGSSSGVTVCSLPEAVDTAVDGVLCIFLPDLERPFMPNMNEGEFAALKHVLNASSLLWLTRAGDDPAFELVTGFARSIREERGGTLRFITLALEGGTVGSPQMVVDRVRKVVEAAVLVPREEAEEDFLERDGVLCIPRIVEANYLNDGIARTVSVEGRKPVQEPTSVERPVRLTIGSLGLLDTLQFVDDHEWDGGAADGLADDEVEIEARAQCLNFFDIMTALGQIPEDFFGGECSGVVSRVGKGVKRFQVGDQVWTGQIAAFRTLVRSPERLVHKVPDGWSFEEAATLPIVYGTCVYAMFDFGRIKSEDTILIHSAAGGVGQAAIHLAKLAGAEVFATVGTPEKKSFLMETFGIPEDRIFSSRDTEAFVLGVKRATGGRGVDIVLNSLAGEGLRATWTDCMAPFGRFLELGKKDIDTFASLPMAPFARNVNFSAVDLFYPMRHDLELMESVMGDVARLAEEGLIKAPTPLNVYTWQNVEEAFRVMQGGKHIGKIVLKPVAGEPIPIMPDTRPKYRFDANATYVIAGGLGGLGRSMARWMVRRGVKYLLLLSRSGVADENARSLISELEALGSTVATPRCDVSNEQELAAALKECSKSMPPIKGCIQGAMVLRDCNFANMSLKDYQAAIKPKVQGSWNLHKLLPKGLDFFILLSSLAGVLGSHGQSNYTAGNSYQDALARHRVAQGERAVSLDLGMILSVGFVAEREGQIERMRSRGYLPIREAEFLALMEHHCDPGSAAGDSTARGIPRRRAQVATGIETPTSLRKRGVEEPFALRCSPLFKPLQQMGSGRHEDGGSLEASGGASADAPGDLKTLLGQSTSVAEAGGIVTDALVRKLAKALSIPPGDVDASRPMHAYGVDSLVAVELRNWISREMRADVAVFELMGGASIASLGVDVAAKSQFLSDFGVAEGA